MGSKVLDLDDNSVGQPRPELLPNAEIHILGPLIRRGAESTAFFYEVVTAITVIGHEEQAVGTSAGKNIELGSSFAALAEVAEQSTHSI
jgi:hypothetical protein